MRPNPALCVAPAVTIAPEEDAGNDRDVKEAVRARVLPDCRHEVLVEDADRVVGPWK